MSAMWADEPSLQALTMAGLFASSVGNHEFDNGRAELLRQQHGGCTSIRPERACKFTPNFGGAGFSYLAKYIISGHEDGSVTQWDAKTGDLLSSNFDVHESDMQSAYTPF